MGSTRVAVFVSTELVNGASDESPYRIRPKTLEEKILGLAFGIFRSEYEEGNHDIRSTHAKMIAPVAIEDPFAELFASDLMSELRHKRDESIIIPVISPSSYTVKKKTVTLKLDGEEFKSGQGDISTKALEALLPEEAKGRICDVRAVQDSNTGNVIGWKIDSTIEVERAVGKSKTVYALVVNGRVAPTNYDTKPEALRGGKTLFENDDVRSVNVIAQVVVDDNPVHVKMVRKVKSATTKRSVSYAVPKAGKTKIDGYWVGVTYRD